jgi:cAMP phosphodiesterase
MNIKLLGVHNIESLNTRLSSLMIDETLVVDAGALTSSLSLDAQRNLKAVLLTHQHYDHIRDIPAFAINLASSGDTVDVCATQQAYDVVTDHLLNGKIYPNFLEYPPDNPTVRFAVIEPLKPFRIEGYIILPVPVKHSVPTVGYQITSPDNKVLFCTSDTGQGLADCWEQVSPQLLIIEVTDSNNFGAPGHLTPNQLRQELITFQEMKGYLPEVVTVHMMPAQEEEIKEEIAVVAEELNSPITVGYEGMEINL